MARRTSACVICRGAEGDQELGRVAVWEDNLWRLTTATGGELLGFSYLEPKRHIPHLTDLDGKEARTLGPVLARTSRALRAATGADLVYVYVFGGGIPHLHFHLAPHREGDPLNDRMIRGVVEETQLPSGATAFASRDFPSLPRSRHTKALARIRRALTLPDRTVSRVERRGAPTAVARRSRGLTVRRGRRASSRTSSRRPRVESPSVG